MATKTVALVASGTQRTYTIPSDFGSLVKVEAIASGLSGNNATYGVGGPGGSYAASTSVSGLSAGSSVYYRIVFNTDGGETYFSTVSGGPSSSSQGVKAVSGVKGTGLSTTGGSAASSIGSVVYSGGAGGSVTGAGYPGGGGGGSAGPGGDGKNGGAGYISSGGSRGGGGGGGCNGGSSTAGGNGGQSGTSTAGNGGTGPTGVAGGLGATSLRAATDGSSGSGGGGAVGGSYPLYVNAGNGSQYPVWTITSSGNAVGPGSGGGGAHGGYAGNYGTGYGGGGGGESSLLYPGSGSQGIIVFTYNSVPVVTITTQPITNTVKEPETATFSIVASASEGTLTYEWQRSNPGTGGAAWGAISGATSSSYTTPATSFATDNGAYYRCVLYVDGVYKATSSVAMLYITPSATGNFFMVF